MCFLSELEQIKGMRDLGDVVEIQTITMVKSQTISHAHSVPKLDLRFLIADELQIPYLQNSGHNTICLSTWKQVQDLMEENGIELPESVSPCHTCDGRQCRFWCTKY